MVLRIFDGKCWWSRVIAACILCCTTPSFAAELPGVPGLKRNEGYLLCHLDIERDNTKIVLRPLIGADSSKRSIDLKRGQQYFLITMRKGNYSTDSVEAPFYNFPHVMDLKNDPAWRFSIEAGKVNYMGELVIKSTRTRRVVDIKLYNRIAGNHAVFAKLHPILLTQYPLRYAGGFRDDFWEFISEK